MAHYPPPPPGGGWAPPAAHDPYAADRALVEFAHARGFQVAAQGDARWYQAWAPFAYLSPIHRVGRDLRAQLGDAALTIAECYEGDALKEVTGEHRHVVAFLVSPRLAYRAAVRSKGGAGIVDGVTQGLDELFGSRPRGFLGDPTFEARFDVLGPTVEEANAALPMPLRQLLLHANFRGILEVRGQGLVVTFFDRNGFDPISLGDTIARVGQLYAAATQYPHVVTPR